MNGNFAKGEPHIPWQPSNDISLKPETDGILQIVAYRNQAGENVPAKYHCGGNIYQQFESYKNAVDGGTMRIGKTLLTADPSRDYSYGLDGTCECQQWFGKTVNFALDGVEGAFMHNAGFVAPLYLPKEIYLLTPKHGEVISKSKGVTIKWNADEQNNKEVMLISLDANTDGTIPKEKAITNSYINTADKGSYTLSEKDFNALAVGSTVRIKLIRGNYDVVISDDFTTYSICGFSYVEDTFELVE